MLAAVMTFVLAVDPTAGTPEKRALWTAIDDLRRTVAMYEAILAVQPKVRPFPRVLRQKRRHLKRIVAVTVKLGHGDPPVLWDAREFVAPRERAGACAAAARQELRNVAIAETALGVVHAARARAVLAKLQRKARYRHLVAFESCTGAG